MAQIHTKEVELAWPGSEKVQARVEHGFLPSITSDELKTETHQSLALNMLDRRPLLSSCHIRFTLKTTQSTINNNRHQSEKCTTE
jgi:hypothetical protein